MLKRILEASSRELLEMNRSELLSGIRASEGRVIVSELVSPSFLCEGVSNAEMAAAFGADLLLLNVYDLDSPFFANVPVNSGESIVAAIKRLAGRPLGVNLEPVDKRINNRIEISPGRQANKANAKRALEQGFDFLVLTGNPSSGVTNQCIVDTIKEIKEEVGDKTIIIAGKMHMSGVKEEYLDGSVIKDIIGAGADIILLPMPGTVPGITVEDLKPVIKTIHKMGALAMNAIGTSQESADEETIKRLALASKMTGADLHHIGDAGYGGMAIPENILAFSIVIRGRRHTYRRMAVSINR